jgi:hypothetical protein
MITFVAERPAAKTAVEVITAVWNGAGYETRTSRDYGGSALARVLHHPARPTRRLAPRRVQWKSHPDEGRTCVTATAS